jgi:hypothetical protein
LSLDLGVVRVRLQTRKGKSTYGLWVGYLFLVLAKEYKKEGDQARREGGKLEERKGRGGKGKDQPKKQRLGSDQTPEGHRRKQHVESKEGRIRWTSSPRPTSTKPYRMPGPLWLACGWASQRGRGKTVLLWGSRERNEESVLYNPKGEPRQGGAVIGLAVGAPLSLFAVSHGTGY